jgi:hypothetical protein
MSLVQRARESGKCSPSLLLAAEQQSDEDGFEEGMLKVLDTTGELYIIYLFALRLVASVHVSLLCAVLTLSF